MKTTSKPGEQHGHDFGAAIDRATQMSADDNYTTIAAKMNMSKQSLRYKTKKPYFGTIYDLIKISQILQQDFISPALEAIHRESPSVRIKSGKTIGSLKDDIKSVEEQRDRLQKVVDRLLSKSTDS